MANGLDVKIVSYALHDATSGFVGDDVTAHLFKAPTDAHGGAIRILEAYAVNAAATGAGTGFHLQLENWGTAGTAIKASGGTIAAELGGTADPWAANTPKAFTLETDNVVLDAGEWLVLRKGEDDSNSSDPTRGVVQIHYVVGQ